MKIDSHIYPLARIATILLPISICFGRIPTEIIFGLINILFLIHWMKLRDLTFLNHPWIKAGIVFWFYIILNSLFAEQTSIALKNAIFWMRFPLGAIAIAYWIRWDKQTTHLAFVSLGIAVTFLVITTLWQYGTGADLLGHPIQSDGRLTGPFTRPRIGATLTWISLPLFYLIAHPGFTRMQSIVIFLGGCLIYSAIFLSGERSAWILISGTLIISALSYTPWKKRTWIMGSICFCFFIIAFLHYPTLFDRQITSSIELLSTLSETLYGHIILASWEIWLEHPLFGIGAGGFRYFIDTPLDPLHNTALHPHNMYLQFLAELGIIGTFLMLLIFYHIIKTQLHAKGCLTWGVVACCWMRIWPFAFMMSMFNSISMIPFWWMIGWSLGMIQSQK